MSVQTLLRITCLADGKSYVVITGICANSCEKCKCIKLKSVQILLKIAGLAHRKSYVVIICANYVKSLSKEKFCQVKVGSNIAQNRLSSR